MPARERAPVMRIQRNTRRMIADPTVKGCASELPDHQSDSCSHGLMTGTRVEKMSRWRRPRRPTVAL
jgi:hypothetical protein